MRVNQPLFLLAGSAAGCFQHDIRESEDPLDGSLKHVHVLHVGEGEGQFAQDPDPFPSATFWGDRVVMWPSEIEQVVEEEIGKEEWNNVRAEADTVYGHAGNLQKNVLHIASSLQIGWEAGKKSKSLQKLCEKIMEFGQSNG